MFRVCASATVDDIDALYDENETKYFEAVDRDTAYDQADALIQHYESEIRSVFGFYADNYAERVFHDRQLCEHVNRTLVAVDFEGRDDWTGPAKQWVERQDNWPAWAVKAHPSSCRTDRNGMVWLQAWHRVEFV
jgi:hypothetical protein